MVLIADSGSTKCDWLGHDSKGIGIFQKRTIGVNPMLLSDMEIETVIQEVRKDIPQGVSRVEFYCAGGNHDESKSRLGDLFQKHFPQANVLVADDLEMAVKCGQGLPGVVCILGTGSNSCFFDGAQIHKRLPDLGFHVMDEGSGNYFGRELLRSHAYGYMPTDLRKIFGDQYDLEDNTIVKELYHGDNPSSYLANFAQFMVQYQEHVFMQGMIKDGVDKVFEHVLGPYKKEMQRHPIYFIGSIAFYLQKTIQNEARKRGYDTVFFIKNPIQYFTTLS